MAAPTNAASEDSPCQPGAVHTWPIAKSFCNANLVAIGALLTSGGSPFKLAEADDELASDLRPAALSGDDVGQMSSARVNSD
jgi:hypothetical protein